MNGEERPAVANHVRSMTGYGAGESPLGAATVHVDVRAVNHRHLDVRVRTPPELAETTAWVEEALRARCIRGRIEAQVRIEGSHSAGHGLDLDQARAVYAGLLRLRDDVAPDEPLPLWTVLSVPGVVNRRTTRTGPELETAVRRAVQQACAALATMRAREGEALAKDIRGRLAIVRDHTDWIAGERERLIQAHKQRLSTRIQSLLEGTELTPDPARLAHEVAWFADKSDVAEEITRLRSHLQQFEVELAAPHASGIGRKLEFLLQELGREVNTIGSKVSDATVAQRVVEIKAELERIREQLQNIL